MASNTALNLRPIALTTTLTTNIYTPPTTTGGTPSYAKNCYAIIRGVRVTNKTGSAATVSLWVGATGANAAGTEFLFQATSVPANSYIDRTASKMLSTADFLVGGSGTATALSIDIDGEIGVSAG